MFVKEKQEKVKKENEKWEIKKCFEEILRVCGIDVVWNLIVNLIYPRHCPVCDDIVKPFGALICVACDKKINKALGQTCLKCGKEIKSDEEEFCYDCRSKKHEFEQGKIGFPYQEMKSSLYRYKYMGRAEYGVYYGKVLANKFGTQLEAWKVDALVPVPLHKTRLQKRGYNQAEIIAKVLGQETGIPVKNNWVKRCKKTVPQKELDGMERQNNLKKAFNIVENDVKLETIVIIDDIYTTGSTIDAMAKICKASGVKNVYFLALAAGQGY